MQDKAHILTMEPRHFLEQVFTEQDFTRKEQEYIISHFEWREFCKGAYLVSEDALVHHYWFLQSGFARSYVIDVQGNDISANFYSAGELVIDWIGFFHRTPAKERIQAITDCCAWQISFDTFQHLYHSVKSFNEHGRGTMVQAYFGLKQHSLAMITEHAKERYRRLLQEKPYIIQNVSLKHIATYLGITDTSLSRIRKELATE